jgi:hypothetical protein
LTFIYCGDGWLPLSAGVAHLNSFVTAVALDGNDVVAHDFWVVFSNCW